MVADTVTGPPGTDLVYLRRAALVVLAGALWSTGGVLVKLETSKNLAFPGPI